MRKLVVGEGGGRGLYIGNNCELNPTENQYRYWEKLRAEGENECEKIKMFIAHNNKIIGSYEQLRHIGTDKKPVIKNSPETTIPIATNE